MAADVPPTTIIKLGASRNIAGLSVLINIAPRNNPKEQIIATIVNIDIVYHLNLSKFAESEYDSKSIRYL